MEAKQQKFAEWLEGKLEYIFQSSNEITIYQAGNFKRYKKRLFQGWFLVVDGEKDEPQTIEQLSKEILEIARSEKLVCSFCQTFYQYNNAIGELLNASLWDWNWLILYIPFGNWEQIRKEES